MKIQAGVVSRRQVRRSESPTSGYPRIYRQRVTNQGLANVVDANRVVAEIATQLNDRLAAVSGFIRGFDIESSTARRWTGVSDQNASSLKVVNA
jgi:hypothetical protein